MSFWGEYSFWMEAVVSAVALAGACSFLGVYMVMRRVVFLPAAISQMAGLGVAVAFLLGAIAPALEGSWFLNPVLASMLASLVVAMLLGWAPEPRRLSRESLIGVVFILASALVVLVGSFIPQGSHDIKDILFGNAVMVERSQMWIALAVSAAVLLVHLVLMRPFMMVSFDRETARSHGVPVAALDGILFLTLGVVIAEATRTIGALPVFAFTVLPPVAALVLSNRVRHVFALAITFGVASAFLGYWASWVFSLPTGSTMAAVSGAIVLAAAALKRIASRTGLMA